MAEVGKKDKTLCKSIETNRSYIMGCAMISILLYHQQFIYEGFISNFWDSFHEFGYWGVEVFLFLSGYGITFALKRHSLSEYAKRRISRIIPSAILVGSIIGLLYDCNIGTDWYYTNSRPIIYTSLWLWYLYALIYYYSFAPIASKILQYTNLGTLFLFSISLLCLTIMNIWTPSEEDPFLIRRITWVIERLPVFLFGMWAGYNKTIVNKKFFKYTTISFLILGTLYLHFLGSRWIGKQSLFILPLWGVPAICLIFSKLKRITDFVNFSTIILWIGQHSLMFYLTQYPIFCFIKEYININPYGQMIIAIGLCFTTTYSLDKLIKLFEIHILKLA